MKFPKGHKSIAIIGFFGFFAASLSLAATLVNINTADLSTLETLNGIGPSKGQAIIDYRTQHGPFQKIEDIQNVSGIGPTTYANIKDYITVGDVSQTQNTQSTSSQATTSQTTTSQDTQTQSSTPGGSGPPPITAKITLVGSVVAGGGTTFEGSAFNQAGEALVSGVRYIWNFGDGTTYEGQSAQHTYLYPGSYVVNLDTAYNFSTADAKLAIAAKVPSLSLALEADGSLTIYNYSSNDLDIGLWSLSDSSHTFTIPQNTTLLASGGLRFAQAVTNVTGTQSVLLFPNGAVAARAAPSADSPLRGVKVASVTMQAPTVPQTSAPAPVTDSGASYFKPPTTAPAQHITAQEATVAQSGLSISLDPSLIALVGVIIFGGAGAWYLAYLHGAETYHTKEEFEIEG